MAKKRRTPPPPRKVQAPKQRHDPRQGLGPARQRQLLFGLAGAGVVALIVVVIVIAAGGSKKSGPSGSAQAIAATMRAAGCSLATSKAAPSAQHIANVTDKVTYSTYPPVSGKHYGVAALWGNYTQVVDPRRAVHNEEHGGIDVWVGPKVPASERAQINSFYDESPNAMLVTPIQDKTPGITYPRHSAPGSKIYLSAWTSNIVSGNIVKSTNVVATCPHVDLKAFRAFRDEFRGKGPERFPLSTLTPGT